MNGEITYETFVLIPPIKENKAEGYQKLKALLEKYDVGKMVEEHLNLKWQQKITLYDMDGGANYDLPDKAYVDYSHGAWAIAGIAHEMVHLILYQNAWTKIPEIESYIKKHEDLSKYTRLGIPGYPIEQMIAYLLMRDIIVEISKDYEGLEEEKVLSQYRENQFNRILKKEYPNEYLRNLGRKIISEWEKRPADISVTEWLKTILV